MMLAALLTSAGQLSQGGTPVQYLPVWAKVLYIIAFAGGPFVIAFFAWIWVHKRRHLVPPEPIVRLHAWWHGRFSKPREPLQRSKTAQDLGFEPGSRR